MAENDPIWGGAVAMAAGKKPELFTVLVTGKGIRLRARVPGWVAALVFSFAKQNEGKSA